MSTTTHRPTSSNPSLVQCAYIETTSHTSDLVYLVSAPQPGTPSANHSRESTTLGNIAAARIRKGHRMVLESAEIDASAALGPMACRWLWLSSAARGRMSCLDKRLGIDAWSRLGHSLPFCTIGLERAGEVDSLEASTTSLKLSAHLSRPIGCNDLAFMAYPHTCVCLWGWLKDSNSG